MTKLDLCSVRAVGGGLGAEEVWQCTGVGGQRSWNPQRREEQQHPGEKWCVVSVGAGGPQETQVHSREKQAG